MNSQAQFLRKGASSKCFFLLFNNARKKYAEYFAEIDQLSLDVEYVYLHKFSEIKNKISAILTQLIYKCKNVYNYCLYILL
ncbi:LacI family transcriptional regulator [Streptococcus pneumoniae]|nr:LacI family transcriptional regulator [Streptococcus pneumoniae]